jgi:hypothetical protein
MLRLFRGAWRQYKQFTGSFKERGARNALLQLPDEQKKRGVIAASAGNHALGPLPPYLPASLPCHPSLPRRFCLPFTSFQPPFPLSRAPAFPFHPSLSSVAHAATQRVRDASGEEQQPTLQHGGQRTR